MSPDRAATEAAFSSQMGFWKGFEELMVVDVNRNLEFFSIMGDGFADPGKEIEFRWDRGVDALRAIVQEPWVVPAILLVGDRDLERLLNDNLDLKAEFGPGTVRFSPLTVDQGEALAEKLLEEHGFSLSASSRKKLQEGLVRMPGELNFRSVGRLVVTIGGNQAARIKAPLRKGKPIASLYDVEPEDIPLDKGLVTKEEVLAKFDELVGLDEIKNELKRLVVLAEARKKKSAELGDVTPSKRNYHFIFRGPPGTGKTTVARLMGDLFFAAGILPKGHLIERDRAGLVGRYLGNSEINLAEAVDEAEGGVLFIDEAYALGSPISEDDRPDEYGQAIINALVQRLYESPGSFSCVIAGYGEEMKDFLETNDGLSSRFNHELVFPSFSATELVGITLDRIKASGMGIDDETGAPARLEPMMQELIDAADPDSFGNARTAIEIGDRAVETALIDGQTKVSPAHFREAIDHAIGMELSRGSEANQSPETRGPASEDLIEAAEKSLADLATIEEHDREALLALIRSFRNERPSVGFVNGLPRGIADFAFRSGEVSEKDMVEIAEAIVALYQEVGLLDSDEVKVADLDELEGGDEIARLDDLFEKASGSGGLVIRDLNELLEAASAKTSGERELAVTALIDQMRQRRNSLAVFLGAPKSSDPIDPAVQRLLMEFEYSA